jgi:parallel beta-helix repeat protein
LLEGSFNFAGLSIENWNTHTLDTSNKVNGNPVYYWKNKTGGVIPSNAGQVILANCTNVSVIGQELTNGSVGIILGFSDKNNLYNNNISFQRAKGIFFMVSSRNNISNNNIYSNDWGIYLFFSGLNNISGNNIYESYEYGIFFYYSDKNNFTSNTVFETELYGIYLEDSDDGIFHHNNIINNGNQFFLTGSWGNVWDDGNGEGNFWSDYTGIDDGSNGRTAGDGVGDTNLPHYGWDNYPLMIPLGNLTYLYEGWNLISIPFIQSDTDLSSVLSSIDGSFDAIQWYNTSDITDLWKHYHISKPIEMNDLENINHNMGFWINITDTPGIVFEYPGSLPTSNQTIQLHSGWNMVGYPSLTNHNRTVGLNNLEFGVDVDAIQWFDATSKTWHVMDLDDPFVPGRGYWVHSKVDASWEVPM